MALSKFDTTSFNTVLDDSARHSPTTVATENHTPCLSIFIPYTRRSTTREQVVNAFVMNQIAVVRQVDMVPKEVETGTYYQMFVHLDTWFDNIAATNIRNKLESGEQARFNYDDPQYWNMYKNTSSMTSNETPPNSQNIIERLQRENLQLSQQLYNANQWISANQPQATSEQQRIINQQQRWNSYVSWLGADETNVLREAFQSTDSAHTDSYANITPPSTPQDQHTSTSEPHAPEPSSTKGSASASPVQTHNDASSEHSSLPSLVHDNDSEIDDAEYMVVPDMSSTVSEREEMTRSLCDNA